MMPPLLRGVNAVCRAIDDALHGEPAISDIRWRHDQPFLGAGAPHPAGRPSP